MKFLLTGGAGFIGHHLLKALLADKENTVICMDDMSGLAGNRKQSAVIPPPSPYFRFIEGSILDKKVLNSIGAVDTVIHLAGKTGVRPSMQQAAHYRAVNVEGTKNLLEYAFEAAVPQFIFASSSSVYGSNTRMPWSEEEMPLPVSPYGALKYEAEILGRLFSDCSGLRFISLRLFNVYGPALRPDLIISKVFDAILNKRPVTLFGDGSSSRNYTYVDDVINGILAAVHYKQTDFETINLAGPEVVPLCELVRCIEEICGMKAILEHHPEQEGDVYSTWGQTRKAANLLNYRPTVMLRDGLQRYYEWYWSTMDVPIAMI